MAERVGFEPTVPCGTLALQASALGRTMQPLQFYPQSVEIIPSEFYSNGLRYRRDDRIHGSG